MHKEISPWVTKKHGDVRSRNIMAHETARRDRAAYSRDNNASGDLLSVHYVKEPASQRATGRSGVSIRGRVAVPRAIPEGWNSRARNEHRCTARLPAKRENPFRSSTAKSSARIFVTPPATIVVTRKRTGGRVRIYSNQIYEGSV